ncbi:MAG: enoyl-CoA hydratase [Crocinitomicaceae bacterium]|nr:enoyl-CoA hydratase [Crocinitomicaceae bacterium]|tara:strand:- start:7333 stop:8106 length:774 start_codon:yes stop_codon:yes gene_type:complete
MEFQNILIDVKDGLATIIINRPKQLNALNKATIKDLNKGLLTLKEDNNVRCIILTGSGEKAFVAGADIKEFAHFGIEEGKKLAQIGQEKLFNLIETFPKPVIAAINGFALGGGLELAMSCHFRVASENAKMGLPEVSLGVIPGYGGTQRLPQLIGKGKAMELITTAKMINAEEALQYHLVNYVVSIEDLLLTCKKIATATLNNSPKAITAAINAVNAGFDNSINGFDKEIEEFGNCFGNDEFKEGTSAFMEKRKPNY